MTWLIFFSNYVSLKAFGCHLNLSYGPGHAKTCLMSYANNKGAVQPAHPCSLISTFVIHCLDSMICMLALLKVSRFYLASVAEQAGLNLTCSEIPEDTFLRDVAYMMNRIYSQSLIDILTIEPPHDKTNKMTCASSEDSDQPGHLPSLISLRCPHEESLGDLATHWAHSKDSDQTGQMPRLIWVFAWRTVILLVFSWGGLFDFHHMDRVKRIWYLSLMRAAKVQTSLRMRAVSPGPSLLAHTSSESRGTFRQKARSLAPLNGWACTVKICHDGMLEDTNSLDGAHLP